MTDLRFKLPPGGDVPPAVAARRLGISLTDFEAKLAELQQRGFPSADPTTGNYDFDAIEEWRKVRHPQLFLTNPQTARNARGVVKERLRRMHGGLREN
jgi:hypothetical protein